MPGATKRLTTREKAVLFAYAAGIIDNIKDAYIAADDKPQRETENQTAINCSVSRWHNSAKVQNTLQQFKKMLADRDAEQRQAGRMEERNRDSQAQDMEPAESVRTKAQPAGQLAKFVDYSDPANQARKLNELINTADDPGEALDALKVIIQTQKADREAAKDQKIVRAYLPVHCAGCPLYEKRRRQPPK